jgi:hypothetical protein
MKSLWIVALLCMSASAVAAPQKSTRPQDRAMTAGPVWASPAPFKDAGECGAERASPLFSPQGSLLGYECLSSANGG